MDYFWTKSSTQGHSHTRECYNSAGVWQEPERQNWCCSVTVAYMKLTFNRENAIPGTSGNDASNNIKVGVTPQQVTRLPLVHLSAAKIRQYARRLDVCKTVLMRSMVTGWNLSCVCGSVCRNSEMLEQANTLHRTTALYPSIPTNFMRIAKSRFIS